MNWMMICVRKCVHLYSVTVSQVLLYELKGALAACETELQSLKAQYEALCPGKSLEIPDKLRGGTISAAASASVALARYVVLTSLGEINSKK